MSWQQPLPTPARIILPGRPNRSCELSFLNEKTKATGLGRDCYLGLSCGDAFAIITCYCMGARFKFVQPPRSPFWGLAGPIKNTQNFDSLQPPHAVRFEDRPYSAPFCGAAGDFAIEYEDNVRI